MRKTWNARNYTAPSGAAFPLAVGLDQPHPLARGFQREKLWSAISESEKVASAISVDPDTRSVYDYVSII